VKYEGATGIHPWDRIFRFLEVTGVLTNTLIYLLLSPDLRALPSGIIALVVVGVFFGVLFLKVVIGCLVPDVPASVLVAIRKGKWMAQELKSAIDLEERKVRDDENQRLYQFHQEMSVSRNSRRATESPNKESPRNQEARALLDVEE